MAVRELRRVLAHPSPALRPILPWVGLGFLADSFGLASYDGTGDAESLVERADAALYVAKVRRPAKNLRGPTQPGRRVHNAE